ncbi:MAG: MBL fold metallo-hydrolase [Thaumarchaeota archaeon]|nr:MAG: MBL fold metallo-hydrolase [Nitrososphaerota archaeon]
MRYVKAKLKFLITGIILISLLAGVLVFSGQKEEVGTETRSVRIGSVKGVKLIVVVDNYPDSELKTAWGLSILAKTPKNTILFDTGPDPDVLKENLKKLGIDPGEIDFVVISHEHGDHINGLSYLAKVRPGLKVYVPKGVAGGIGIHGLEVKDVDKTMEVAEGIAVIGWLYGPPAEEALAINVEGRGLVILVGCSHPGVTNIVAKAKTDLGVKPYLVLGGFHMLGASESTCKETIKRLIELGVEKIAPIHCSGDGIRSILEKDYPQNWLKCHVGSVIEVSASTP